MVQFLKWQASHDEPYVYYTWRLKKKKMWMVNQAKNDWMNTYREYSAIGARWWI